MKRPNILFITTDQQHWSAMGCQSEEIQTPALDRLAAEGTLFERAYCPNPTCTPTRASLITGLYPSQHGAYSLGTKLDERVPTIGELLREQGYDVSLIGKAHFQPLASTPEYPSVESYPIMQDLEFWRNFDQPFYGFNHVELARNHTDEGHAGQHYALWMEEKGFTSWRKHYREPGGTCTEKQLWKWALPEEFHYNEWIVERSIERMQQCQDGDEPFFLWASFPDPHPPYLVPEPWDTLYDPNQLTLPRGQPGEHDKNPWHFQATQTPDPNFDEWSHDPDGNRAVHGCGSHILQSEEEMRKNMAVYYGMMSYTDKAIGRILDWLDASGMRDDTLIIFTSDHGHLFGQHNLCAKGPFHYEDLLRVPMIVSLPGAIPANRRSHALQSLVDIPCTVLDYAGINIPRSMTGRNQRTVWQGDEQGARDHVIVENRHQPNRVSLKTYITQRYKITTYQHMDDGELFDLQQDPGEFNNLWNDPAAADIKCKLLREFLVADWGTEPIPMPRVSGA